MHFKKNVIPFALSLTALALILAGAFQNCGGGGSGNDVSSSNGPKGLSDVSCPIDSASAPALLSETCYGKFAAATLPDDVYLYEPQYPLWTNGADKSRWIHIPNGAKIDNSDVNNWKFPKGTILWKEFVLGGKKIETRMLEKIGSGIGKTEWRASLYIWRNDQTQADLLTAANESSYISGGHLQSPVDSTYYLPNLNACVQCHKSSTDMALGFSSVQLTHSKALGLNVDGMLTAGLLTHTVTTPDLIAGTALDRKALGYIHANCASCHSPTGTMTSLDMRHLAGSTSLETENAYLKLIAAAKILPGNGAASPVVTRMSAGEMPASAFPFLKDEASIEMLKKWINSTSSHIPNCPTTLTNPQTCTPTAGTTVLGLKNGMTAANCPAQCETWLKTLPDGANYCCRFNSDPALMRCDLYNGTATTPANAKFSSAACTK